MIFSSRKKLFITGIVFIGLVFFSFLYFSGKLQLDKNNQNQTSRPIAISPSRDIQTYKKATKDGQDYVVGFESVIPRVEIVGEPNNEALETYFSLAGYDF